MNSREYIQDYNSLLLVGGARIPCLVSGNRT